MNFLYSTVQQQCSSISNHHAFNMYPHQAIGIGHKRTAFMTQATVKHNPALAHAKAGMVDG